MRLKNRSDEGDMVSGLNMPSSQSTSGGNLRGLRNESEKLLEAADEAIGRALSGDSEEFVRHSKQEGGQ